jgi:hypothetical protein
MTGCERDLNQAMQHLDSSKSLEHARSSLVRPKFAESSFMVTLSSK